MIIVKSTARQEIPSSLHRVALAIETDIRWSFCGPSEAASKCHPQIRADIRILTRFFITAYT